MTVYSWNMLFRNRKLDEALRWIEQLDFDVLCLQEVPDAFLEKLRSLPWHLAIASEGTRHFSDRGVVASVVIVSKLAIIAQGVVPLEPLPTPPRVDWFIRLMRPFHFTRITERNALYADLDAPGGTLRVINAHLSLSYPAQRAREFERLFALATPNAIVCGDFNVVESPKVSLLNFLMGGTARDAVHFSAERALLEAAFAERGLKNPLRHQITHSFGLSQLDHILVPAALPLKRCGVLRDAHGSDHRPIFVIAE